MSIIERQAGNPMQLNSETRMSGTSVQVREQASFAKLVRYVGVKGLPDLLAAWNNVIVKKKKLTDVGKIPEEELRRCIVERLAFENFIRDDPQLESVLAKTQVNASRTEEDMSRTLAERTIKNIHEATEYVADNHREKPHPRIRKPNPAAFKPKLSVISATSLREKMHACPDEDRRRQMREAVREELEAIGGRNLALLSRYMGLDGEPAASYDDIAREWKRSRNSVHGAVMRVSTRLARNERIKTIYNS